MRSSRLRSAACRGARLALAPRLLLVRSMTSTLRSLVVVMLGAAGAALADEKQEELDPPPPPRVTTHTEFVFGFMGGQRDQSWSGFVVGNETAGTPGAASLVGPFTAPPISNAIVSGPTWEVREVHRRVRMTVGLQKPFALFRPTEGAGAYDVDGVSRSITVRTLQLWDIRLGLGWEYSIRRVTPFIDLLGDIRWANAELTVDGLPASYKAWSFAYSLRAGARVQVSDAMFIAASAEASVMGAPRFGGQLVLGFAFPFD